MTAAHSFFIPDIEFLIDLEGLICYLGMFMQYFLGSLSHFVKFPKMTVQRFNIF